jgi:hypothetical protein
LRKAARGINVVNHPSNKLEKYKEGGKMRNADDGWGKRIEGWGKRIEGWNE